MNFLRGDVVLVDFRYSSGVGAKVRPALVIQNDNDNRRLLNTIVVQITGTTRRSREVTPVLIELSTPEGKQSGLAFDSMVNCVNIVTLDKGRVLRKLGSLPDEFILKVNDALKAAMSLG